MVSWGKMECYLWSWHAEQLRCRKLVKCLNTAWCVIVKKRMKSMMCLAATLLETLQQECSVALAWLIILGTDCCLNLFHVSGCIKQRLMALIISCVCLKFGGVMHGAMSAGQGCCHSLNDLFWPIDNIWCNRIYCHYWFRLYFVV